MFDSISKFSPRKRLAFDSGIIFLFSLLVCLPILLDGIPSSMDIPQQYQMAQSFYDSILNGEFYPSWANQPNYGYGDVSVRFYPPLTYYILSFFRFLVGNWFDASCLFFISLFFVSGLGVYLFAKERFSATASLVAAIVYIWLPYHVMQIYIGGLFAEFTAAAIMPFCLLFVNRVCEKGRLIDICGLALFFGLILITHLPTTVIASLSLFVYSLFTLRKANFFQSVGKLGVSVFLSFLMSSFYLVRMITELDYVKHSGDAFSTGNYSYKTQFVFSYYFPFLDVTQTSAFASFNVMAILAFGILLPGLIYYYRQSKRNEISSLANVIAMTFFGLIMATPISLVVWEMFPLLQKIQFPFRWLTVFTLGTAILSAASFSLALEYYKTPKRYLSIIIFGLLFISMPYNYGKMMNPYVTYPRFFLNSLTNGFKSQPSYECWWTTWAQKSEDERVKHKTPRPDFLPDKVSVNERTFEVKTWNATERIFTINEGQSGKGFVATLYYPHWKATINGRPVEVTAGETGLISFPVPAEKSEVRLFFQEPSHVIKTYYLSGFAWFFLFILLLGGSYKVFKSQPSNPLNVE